MGQYYKSLIIDKNHKITVLDPWLYENGSKLMEHSYIGNNFVNSALSRIYHYPCQVAWVGDYSEDGACVYNNKENDFNEYYDICWGENAEKSEGETFSINLDIENCDYYLVNHDKKVFLNLKKYVEENKWHEEGDYYSHNTGEEKHYSYDMCINPLPLLTACGNGQGGGDYRGTEKEVGSWALDIISLEDKLPLGFEEFSVSFKEER